MHLSLKTEQDITPQNLRKLETMLTDGNSMLLNHAEWCGHCNILKPHWNSFKQTQSAKNINVIEVESRALQALENNPKIYTKITPRDKMVYFPMIIVFIRRKGKITKVFYKGNKTSSDLANFVDKKMEPHGQDSPRQQESLKPRQQESLKPRQQESLKPRQQESPKPRQQESPKSPYPSPSRNDEKPVRVTKPTRATRAARATARSASPSPKPRAAKAARSASPSPKPRAAKAARSASPSPKPRAAKANSDLVSRPASPKPRVASPPKIAAKAEDDDVFMSLYDLNRRLDNYINKYG